jgi:hypothetical protein
MPKAISAQIEVAAINIATKKYRIQARSAMGSGTPIRVANAEHIRLQR